MPASLLNHKLMDVGGFAQLLPGYIVGHITLAPPHACSQKDGHQVAQKLVCNYSATTVKIETVTCGDTADA